MPETPGVDSVFGLEIGGFAEPVAIARPVLGGGFGSGAGDTLLFEFFAGGAGQFFLDSRFEGLLVGVGRHTFSGNRKGFNQKGIFYSYFSQWSQNS